MYPVTIIVSDTDFRLIFLKNDIIKQKRLCLSAIYEPIEKANLALNKRAWLLSTSKSRADITVDGKIDPRPSTYNLQIGPEVDSAWQVDLEAVYDIKHVVIFTRAGKFTFVDL